MTHVEEVRIIGCDSDGTYTVVGDLLPAFASILALEKAAGSFSPSGEVHGIWITGVD
ncbi:hypothetical protein ES703_114876 [subsurface metagenome]